MYKCLTTGFLKCNSDNDPIYTTDRIFMGQRNSRDFFSESYARIDRTRLVPLDS